MVRGNFKFVFASQLFCSARVQEIVIAFIAMIIIRYAVFFTGSRRAREFYHFAFGVLAPSLSEYLESEGFFRSPSACAYNNLKCVVACHGRFSGNGAVLRKRKSCRKC